MCWKYSKFLLIVYSLLLHYRTLKPSVVSSTENVTRTTTLPMDEMPTMAKATTEESTENITTMPKATMEDSTENITLPKATTKASTREIKSTIEISAENITKTTLAIERSETEDNNSSSTMLTTTPLQIVSILFNPTLDMVEDFMQTDFRMIRYLNGFKNTIQRKIVETQITFCPFVSFCKFDIEIYDSKKGGCCIACQCEDCVGTGKCCPSILSEEMFNVTNVNAEIFDVVDDILGNVLDIEIKPTCVSKYIPVGQHMENNGFKAIAKCPRRTDSALQSNCTRPYTKDLPFQSILPVWSNSSLEIFRNKYCAYCNGLPHEELVSFVIDVSCTDLSELQEIKDDIKDFMFAAENCTLTLRPDSQKVNLNYCDYHISTCNETGLWKEYDATTELACHLYESLFSNEKHLYRNIFCAMCNGHMPEHVLCSVSHPTLTETFSFSGLLRLDFDDGFSVLTEDKIVERSSCDKNQLYDPLMERCKDLKCAEMRTLRHGKCVHIYRSVHYQFSYVLKVRFVPTSNLRLAHAYDNIDDIILTFKDQILFENMYLCNVHFVFKSNEKFERSDSESLTGSFLQYIDAKIESFNTAVQKPWDIAESMLQVHGNKLNVLDKSNSSVEFTVYIQDRDDRVFIVVERLRQTIDYKVLFAATAEEQVKTLFKYSMADTDGRTLLPLSKTYNLCPVRSGTVEKIDVLRFSSCPKVNMSQTDVSWSERIDGIQVKNLMIAHNQFYHMDKNTIMICSEAFERIVAHLQPKRELGGEIILSITSSVLSIIALLITFGAFCLFPKLRIPLPGKNNMALTLTLLLAQCVILISSLTPLERYSKSCKAVGLLTHFTWLCCIFWMNVCTYHMFRVLTRTKPARFVHDWKRFILYTIYVITMSSIFVLGNVVYSLSAASEDLGYGGKYCYLTSQTKILLTFVIPTCLVIIANISMFLLVVIKIKHVKHVHQEVRHDRNDIVIFAKLSTITGLCWIFGFVYSWTNIKAFSYLFIVFNASQGVFIMFAFIINRRVFNMCKEFKKTSQDRVRLKIGSKKSSGTRSTAF